jgi:Doubled CXXCH motif (Paired_CXXCH_1)
MKTQNNFVKQKNAFYKWGMLIIFAGLVLSPATQAQMPGNCVDCHTMHNSQDGQPMNFDASATPNGNLIRGTCLGCHAQGKSSAIEIRGSSRIPQVYHAGATDLAAGNFAYITGFKGGGASDRKGHNLSVIGLTDADTVLHKPPGGMNFLLHNDGSNVNTTNLTCAGTNGCHGYRATGDATLEGITGAHHKNSDGQVTLATEPGNSYRFLMGVKGLEDADWEENASSSTHNEYLALPEPIKLGCGLSNCHLATGVQPPDGTMSQYCATCHGNFHTLETLASDGIGAVASSPFIRHPTDLSLPSTGEYSNYTVYNIGSPVGRINGVPASSSPNVQGDAAVMCLSCHVSHASDFPSMLRWDYSTMIADGGGGNIGCFACHTTKD